MRGMILSLVLILSMLGFVIAVSVSDTQTNFYVNNPSADSPEKGLVSGIIDWDSSLVHWIIFLIISIIILVTLRKIFGKKKAPEKVLRKRKKVSAKKIRKVKKVRRKK